VLSVECLRLSIWSSDWIVVGRRVACLGGVKGDEEYRERERRVLEVREPLKLQSPTSFSTSITCAASVFLVHHF